MGLDIFLLILIKDHGNNCWYQENNGELNKENLTREKIELIFQSLNLLISLFHFPLYLRIPLVRVNEY